MGASSVLAISMPVLHGICLLHRSHPPPHAPLSGLCGGRSTLYVERAAVQMSDIDGPRGGVDGHCRTRELLRPTQKEWWWRTQGSTFMPPWRERLNTRGGARNPAFASTSPGTEVHRPGRDTRAQGRATGLPTKIALARARGSQGHPPDQGGPAARLELASVRARLEQHGEDRLAQMPPRPSWLRLLDQFESLPVRPARRSRARGDHRCPVGPRQFFQHIPAMRLRFEAAGGQVPLAWAGVSAIAVVFSMFLSHWSDGGGRKRPLTAG